MHAASMSEMEERSLIFFDYLSIDNMKQLQISLKLCISTEASK